MIKWGIISFDDEENPVRIRLKGDWTDHLIGEKWSFELKKIILSLE